MTDLGDQVAREEVAIAIICEGCGEWNWRKGPRRPLMADRAESRFDCENCGRQLETGNQETTA